MAKNGKERISFDKSLFSNTSIEVQIEFKEMEGMGGDDASVGSSLRIRKKLKDQEQVILKQKVYLDEVKKQIIIT